MKAVKVDLIQNEKQIRNNFKENKQLKQKLFKNKVKVKDDFKEQKEIKEKLRKNLKALPQKPFVRRPQQ
jgi:hypothetical protein